MSASPAVPNRAVMASRSSFAFMRVVSITRSAIARSAPRSLRSSATPSATLPSGASGCRRRVSLKRRSRVSSEQSRKTTSSLCPERRTSSTAWGVWSRKRPSRASMTRASRCSSSDAPCTTRSSSLGTRTTGRLSMQNQPASSSALMAVDLPPPDIPVSSTMRKRDGNSLHLVADTAGHRRLRDLARQLLLEVLRRVVALQLQQVVARGDFDDGGQVAARAHRDDEQRHFGIQDAVLLLLDAEAVVLDPVVPFDQLDHHLHLLAIADGRAAEQVLDVDDPDAANLHVVLDDLGGAAVDGPALSLLQVDDVVGHQAVPAGDQVERQLALADSALPQDEHADADHVDEHAVHRRAGGERFLEEALHVVDERAGEVAGAQERDARVVRLALDHVVDGQVLGDDEAGDRQPEEIAHARLRFARLERREVAHLRIAEHLQAVLVDVLGESAQREPRLLDARADHAAIETALPGEKLQPQVEILVLQKRFDLDGVHPDSVYNSAPFPTRKRPCRPAAPFCSPSSSPAAPRRKSPLRLRTRRRSRRSRARCRTSRRSTATS